MHFLYDFKPSNMWFYFKIFLHLATPLTFVKINFRQTYVISSFFEINFFISLSLHWLFFWKTPLSLLYQSFLFHVCPDSCPSKKWSTDFYFPNIYRGIWANRTDFLVRCVVESRKWFWPSRFCATREYQWCTKEKLYIQTDFKRHLGQNLFTISEFHCVSLSFILINFL